MIRAKLAQYKNPWSELRLSYGEWRGSGVEGGGLCERERERKESARKEGKKLTLSSFFFFPFSSPPSTQNQKNRLQQGQGLHRGGGPLHPLLRREAGIRPLGRAQGRRPRVTPLPLRLVLQEPHAAGAGAQVRHADQARRGREEGGGGRRSRGQGRRRPGQEGRRRVEGVKRGARRRRRRRRRRQGGQEGEVHLRRWRRRRSC